MLDEKQTNSEQGEYKLKEEEGLHDYFTEQLQTSATSNRLNRVKALKRLLIPVGLVVVIIIIYNVLGWLSSRKVQHEYAEEQQVAEKQQAAQPAAPTPQQPSVPTTATAPSVPQVPTIETPPAGFDQKLNLLAQQTESNKQQFSTLNEKIGEIQTNLNDVSKTIDTLTQAVQALAKETLQRTPAAVKQQKGAEKAIKFKVSYHIKAIVPGRVWLESSRGETLSLKVGDPLNGYGKVVAISPNQGLVVTSTGKMIRYGSNDS